MGVAVPLILLTVLTAGAMLFSPPRARAWSTLLALIVAPALLAASVWDVAAFVSLRDRPLVLSGLVLGAGLLVVFGARLFHRRPEWIALAAAAALPFRVPISVDGSVSNLLLPLYLVIGAAAVSYAVPRIFGDEPVDVRERRPHLLEWLLAATLVLYAAQSIGSLDTDTAVEHVVFFYVPFALLFAQLARLEWTLDLAGRMLAVLVVLALAFAAVGFVEYATRHLLLNPKVIASNQVESYFRVNSLFFDPNIYGRFLAVVMLGVATVLLWAERRRTLVLSGLVIAVLWAGLVLTLSQSSFAALLVGLAVLGGLRWSARVAVLGVAAALLCGVVLVLAVPSHLGVSLGDKDGANATTSGRYDLISGGVRLAADRPLRGYGSGGFSRAYRRAEQGSAERAVSASHTTPVTVAAEQGIGGLLLYLALLVTALVTLLRGASGSALRAAVGASFVAIVVHTMSYSAFLEDPLTWVLLASGLAAALAVRVSDGDDAPEPV